MNPQTRQIPFIPVLVSALFLLFLVALSSPAFSKPKAADLVEDGQLIDLNQKKYHILFQELQDKHSFNKQELDKIFTGVSIDRKVLVLMDRQWESKPYYKYYPLFITPKVISMGKAKLKEHKDLLDRIEQKLGVDRETVIAIWAIESKFGAHRGRYGVLQTLNTLFDAYPRRSKFFRKQLVHFLLLCKENQIDPHTVKGSYAGAFGQTQFIPSSFREYAVSFDGDKKRDVFNSVDDILASIANYLRRYHWVLDAPVYAEIGSELKDQRLLSAKLKGRKGRVDWKLVRDVQGVALLPSPANKPLSIVSLEISPEKGGGFRYIAGYPNFHAITAWNHSNRYATAVSELAEAFKTK